MAGGVGPDGAYRYLTLDVTVQEAATPTAPASARPSLPVTGQALPKLVAIALLVLAVGVGLVGITRRRPV